MNSGFIIGLDEAGRGSVAGPIVAAAVLSRGLAREKKILSQVKDSKLLTALQRGRLFTEISQNFIWDIFVLDNEFIDEEGIQQANFLVVENALNNIQNKFKRKSKIVVDYIGGHKRYFNDFQADISFHKNGESKFLEIAAASIVAKVYRDMLMINFCKEYPEYNFSRHKGYGTKEHLDNIQKFGPCPIHRQSFLSKYL